jgi:hypothetical protein
VLSGGPQGEGRQRHGWADGIRGKGQMMMLEKNSDGIAAFLERWVRENVK